MATTKKGKTTASSTKRRIGKPPTLAERITDTSTDSMTNIRFIPKKSTVKK